MERTNIRNMTREDIPGELDFISVDVSFISLKLVLPVAKELLKPHGEMVCLIKPQFEAGRRSVGKKGVVRDKTVHYDVVHDTTEFTIRNGFTVLDLDFSPIKGPEGNIEYLMHIEKSEAPRKILEQEIRDVVERSYEDLEGI
jgi:23S rRNA (cytidine1920-2'-O)/16S rRNA (cytidine1409-2'-O)-methyltransferase